MVIDNFYVKYLAILPSKANSPLLIYSNAMLPFSVAF